MFIRKIVIIFIPKFDGKTLLVLDTIESLHLITHILTCMKLKIYIGICIELECHNAQDADIFKYPFSDVKKNFRQPHYHFDFKKWQQNINKYKQMSKLYSKLFFYCMNNLFYLFKKYLKIEMLIFTDIYSKLEKLFSSKDEIHRLSNT